MMVELNVIKILEAKNKSKYWLFNELNKVRSANAEPPISYTNFKKLIEQRNSSITYRNIEELCFALNCEISDLLSFSKNNSKV